MGAGGAQPNISREKIIFTIVALPPRAEQHRIVAKVDELMSLCDTLEQQQESSITAHKTLVETLLAALTNAADKGEFDQAWTRIAEHFDTLFTTEHSIDQLKQTILQLAVMGKLVPQNPNDEPASELLKRIAAEKAQLIKDKKIKPQKPLPPIGEDEKPYQLPVGWEWCRIGNAAISTDYGLSDKSSVTVEGVPVLAMGNIQAGEVVLEAKKKVPSALDSLPALFVKDRDLLYNRTNSEELVGKTGIYRGVDDQYTYASYLIRIRFNKSGVIPEFVNTSMLTTTFRETQIVPHLKKQCGQANVNGTIMKNMLVAIAPDVEMARIVEKCASLIETCQRLKWAVCQKREIELTIAENFSNSF
jgi:type I restriction enzyme S subunit